MPKIMSVNAWGGRLDWRLMELVDRQKPDILMLQELNSSPQGPLEYFDLLERLKTRTGYNGFFSPVGDRLVGLKKTYFGLGILSKYPIKDKNYFWLEGGYRANYDEERDGWDDRLVQHATITLPSGIDIHAINCHFKWIPGSKAGDESTYMHALRVAAYAAGLGEPAIVAGDMNLAPGADSMKPLNATLDNLCDRFSVKTTRNQLSPRDARGKRDKTIVDYMLLNKHLQLKQNMKRPFRVLPDLVSDHRALVAHVYPVKKEQFPAWVDNTIDELTSKAETIRLTAEQITRLHETKELIPQSLLLPHGFTPSLKLWTSAFASSAPVSSPSNG